MSTPTRPRPARTLVLTAVAALGLLGAAGPAYADSGPPQLSIHVDDGRTDAGSGTTLRYALTVTNLGGGRVRDLAVSQTVPPGTTLGPPEEGGKVSKGVVRWEVDVPAGASVTLTTSVEVGKDLQPGELRLATVACASTSVKAPPIVCASDSDELPAGAAAVAQQQTVDAPAGEGHPGWLLPVGLAGGGLLLVGALGTGLLVKRREDAPGRRELVSHEPG